MIALLIGSSVAILFAFKEAKERLAADENARQANIARAQAIREAYKARLAAALAALTARDYAEAALELDATAEELRGWEWRYLQRRRLDESPKVLNLANRFKPVYDLLSIGKRVVALVAFEDKFALVDTTTGALINTLPKGRVAQAGATRAGAVVMIYEPGEPLTFVDSSGKNTSSEVSFDIGAARFAVNHDGNHLAVAWKTGGTKDRIEIRQWPAGRILRSLPGVTGVNDLSFTADGKSLAAACDDGSVYLWQLQSETAALVLNGHNKLVRGVEFRPDGKVLLSWGQDGTIRQWSVPDGKPIDSRRGHNSQVFAARYSDDGQWIVSGGEDRRIRLCARAVVTPSRCCPDIPSVFGRFCLIQRGLRWFRQAPIRPFAPGLRRARLTRMFYKVTGVTFILSLTAQTVNGSPLVGGTM